MAAAQAASSGSWLFLGFVSPSLTKDWDVWSNSWSWLTRSCQARPLPVWQTQSLVPGQDLFVFCQHCSP